MQSAEPSSLVGSAACQWRCVGIEARSAKRASNFAGFGARVESRSFAQLSSDVPLASFFVARRAGWISVLHALGIAHQLWRILGGHRFKGARATLLGGLVRGSSVVSVAASRTPALKVCSLDPHSMRLHTRGPPDGRAGQTKDPGEVSSSTCPKRGGGSQNFGLHWLGEAQNPTRQSVTITEPNITGPEPQGAPRPAGSGRCPGSGCAPLWENHGPQQPGLALRRGRLRDLGAAAERSAALVLRRHRLRVALGLARRENRGI